MTAQELKYEVYVLQERHNEYLRMLQRDGRGPDPAEDIRPENIAFLHQKLKVEFEIDEEVKHRLVRGLDDIGLTLQHEDDVPVPGQRGRGAGTARTPTDDDPLRVVDLGCGNAYLTMAAHRYLTEQFTRHLAQMRERTRRF